MWKYCTSVLRKNVFLTTTYIPYKIKLLVLIIIFSRFDQLIITFDEIFEG
jgi:hypothetical protein